jgi:hypothetical protein
MGPCFRRDDESGFDFQTAKAIVIASQRVGAKRRPMTGSAKQSIERQKRKLDCFVAFAPRNDVEI